MEELKYMTSSGLFPDGSILLTVEGETICDRLFPPIFDRFKVARDKRIKLRNEKKEEMLKQRVSAEFWVFDLFDVFFGQILIFMIKHNCSIIDI